MSHVLHLHGPWLLQPLVDQPLLLEYKEKVDIAQQKRDQFEKVLQCVLQSKSQEVTVEEVNKGEM